MHCLLVVANEFRKGLSVMRVPCLDWQPEQINNARIEIPRVSRAFIDESPCVQSRLPNERWATRRGGDFNDSTFDDQDRFGGKP
jgi:hypothetical protein